MIMFLPSALFVILSANIAAAIQAFESWGHQRIQLEDVSIHFRYSESGKPPLLLVHGFPQHSRTWTTIGPILAEQYTVIAPDNRGSGESGLSRSDNYTAPAAASDLLAILNYLNISSTHVLSHDKGVGLATSLAAENPDLVDRLILVEYPLPGYGYTTSVNSPMLYKDWQLAFFAVPEAATFFIQGREREMLSWYFWHGSYSGNDVISNDVLDVYTRAISKPGFLRAGFRYFAAAVSDAEYFQNYFNTSGRLQMPVLAMGGEASISPATALEEIFSPIAENLTVDVIPKAGHWIGNENPAWTANRALRFFEGSDISAVDISWLDNTISLFGNLAVNDMPTPGTNGSEEAT